MNLNELNQISKIVEAKYQQRQQAFQKLMQQENKLRSDLARLDDQERAAEQTGDQQMRSIGADVIWKAWIGRSKTQLNLELAQVLAQKEHHIHQVRMAYGKVITTNELVDKKQRTLRKTAADDQLLRAIELTIQVEKRRY